jgi:hypothetical protein
MTALWVNRCRPRRAFTFDVRGWIPEAKVQLLDSERCEDSERANQAVRGYFPVLFCLHDALAEGEGGRVSPKLQRGETPLPAR